MADVVEVPLAYRGQLSTWDALVALVEAQEAGVVAWTLPGGMAWEEEQQRQAWQLQSSSVSVKKEDHKLLRLLVEVAPVEEHRLWLKQVSRMAFRDLLDLQHRDSSTKMARAHMDRTTQLQGYKATERS